VPSVVVNTTGGYGPVAVTRSIESTPPPATPPPAVVSSTPFAPQNPSCAGDIFFIIDSTGSVRNYYDAQIDYVISVIQKLNLANSRVATLMFSGVQRQQIPIKFDSYHTLDELTKAIKRVPLMGGVTAVGAALTRANEIIPERQGPNVPLHIVVVTDGFSFDSVQAPADALRALPNVIVWAAGVASPTEESQLEIIAGGKDRVLLGKEKAGDLVAAMKVC
jgi:hypothetical protein